MLLGKIRITVCPKKRVESSKRHFSFYKKYAFLVFKTLRKPLFQNFLHWMLRRERIEEHKVKDVQIRMFPLRKENGNGLAGKCNSEGKILIYPKRLGVCRKKIQGFGKEKFYFYIRSRARAALIHELLHLKYADDEEKVRELTQEYFNIFIKHQYTQSSDAHNIAKMLFT